MTNNQKNLSLFNEGETYKEEATNLSNAVRMLLRGVFVSYMNKGYSTREIASIISEEVTMLACELRLQKQFENRKK